VMAGCAGADREACAPACRRRKADFLPRRILPEDCAGAKIKIKPLDPQIVGDLGENQP
jgi:hypothetical protein